MRFPASKWFRVPGAAALGLTAALFASAPALAQQSAPDHVVLSSGEYLRGHIIRLNERQVEIDAEKLGQLLIPRDLVVALAVSTPAERISTDYVDPTLFAEGGTATIEPPPIPAGRKLFSIMPGDSSASRAPEPGSMPRTGPLNPLDGRQYASLEASAPGSAALRPERRGQDGVALSGSAQVDRGRGWEDLPVGGQLKAGDKVRVSASSLSLKLRGGWEALIQPGTEMKLAEASAERVSLTVECGYIWLETKEAEPLALDVSTPEVRVATRSSGFAVRCNDKGSDAATFGGPARLTNQVLRSAPLVLESMQMARVSKDGSAFGPAPLKPEDRERFRDPK